MHADVAARHGEGVDGGVVNHEEVEFALVARADRDQLVTELVEIGLDFRVVQIARVGIDVAHDGAPERLFLLVGKVLPRHLAQIGRSAARTGWMARVNASRVRSINSQRGEGSGETSTFRLGCRNSLQGS